MDSNKQTDMDILLSFELDRRIISAGELATLSPGYVFNFGEEEAAVTIRANGKAVARGRLVDVDGKLGIQLTDTL